MTPEPYSLYTVVGPVEADPEYQLIVDSNNMAVEIDNEISKSQALSFTHLCILMVRMYCIFLNRSLYFFPEVFQHAYTQDQRIFKAGVYSPCISSSYFSDCCYCSS